MDCDKTQKLLSEYLDDALPPSERKAADDHLSSCTQCAASLKELQRTVQVLHDLEEITPPQWMTQKIMSRIKTDVEQKKKGLFQKLFFPLYVKLPIETAGIVLIAITAMYVYKTMEPEIKPAAVYSEKPAVTSPLKDQSLPAQPAREKSAQPPAPMLTRTEEKADVTRSAEEKMPLPATVTPTPSAPAPAAAPAPHPAPEQPSSVKEEAFRENRSEPAEAKAKGALEKRLPAAGGLAAHDQARQETERQAAKKAAVLPENVDIVLSFRTSDLDKAGKDIKETLSALGGRIVREEPGPDILIVMSELSSDKLLQFMNKLKALGYLKERVPTPRSDKERVLMKITVSKQQQVP